MRGTISKPVGSVTQCAGICQRYSQSLPITGYDGAPTGCCGTRSDMLIFHSTNTQTLSLLSFAAHVVGSPTTRPSANGTVRCGMLLDAKRHGTPPKAFMKRAGCVNACADRYATFMRRPDRAQKADLRFRQTPYAATAPHANSVLA